MLVRAGGDYVSFVSGFRLENPLAETVDEPVALRTAGLYYDENSIIFQSLPKGVND